MSITSIVSDVHVTATIFYGSLYRGPNLLLCITIKVFEITSPVSRSSKLASLFGIDRTSADTGNSSLTYTAPKEPKRKQQGDVWAGSGPTIILLLPALRDHWISVRLSFSTLPCLSSPLPTFPLMM